MVDEDTVQSVCESHALRVKRPFGRCREVSERLVMALARKGVEARLLRCSDGRFEAPDADRRWYRKHRGSATWVHYVVQIGDRYFDLTRQQFFPDAEHPYSASMGDLARDWQTISPA